MIFIQLKNEEWWQYDAKHSRLYNIRGGHRSADNIDLSKAIYFENWHDLYKQTGFNPLIDNINMWHCGWISPYGDFYPCEAHEADAEDIYSLVYGEEHCYYSDKLIALHWIKVTNSLMYDIYKSQGAYDYFYSSEQENKFYQWHKTYMPLH